MTRENLDGEVSGVAAMGFEWIQKPLGWRERYWKLLELRMRAEDVRKFLQDSSQRLHARVIEVCQLSQEEHPQMLRHGSTRRRDCVQHKPNRCCVVLLF